MRIGRRTGPPVPPAAGPDEETIRLERKLFLRRRRWSRVTRLRPLLIGLLAAVVLAGAAYAVGFTSVLGVRTVSVQGTSFLTTAQIRGAAAVPADEPLLRVDLDAVRRRVERIQGVQSARVSRSWPHTLSVRVTERTPVAVVASGGRFQGVDRSGVLFRTWDTRPAGLPLIESDGAKRSALAESARVVGSLSPALLRRVEHVSVKTVDDIQLVMRSGRTVLWGSSERSAEKAEVLAQLAKKPSSLIDVRVPSRPTTKS